MCGDFSPTSKQAILQQLRARLSSKPIQFCLPGGQVPKTAPPTTSDANHKAQGFHLCFWHTSYKSGFPQTRPWIRLICFSCSQNSGKHIYWVMITDITKDTGEEMRRVRNRGRGQSFHVTPFSGTSICSAMPLELLWTLSSWVLGRLHYINMVD